MFDEAGPPGERGANDKRDIDAELQSISEIDDEGSVEGDHF